MSLAKTCTETSKQDFVGKLVVYLVRILVACMQDVMKDPVMAGDGYTYERLAIESWLANHGTSPISNEELPNKSLIANHSLRSAISEWQQRHGAGT